MGCIAITGQSQKNHGSMVALLLGKFLQQSGKFLQQSGKFCDKAYICPKLSGWQGNCPDGN